MSEQTRALLTFYFNKKDGRLFSLVDESVPCDIAIIDLDHPGAVAYLLREQKQQKIPFIGLSYKQVKQDNPLLRVVGKPVSLAELEQAAKEMVAQKPDRIDTGKTSPVVSQGVVKKAPGGIPVLTVRARQIESAERVSKSGVSPVVVPEKPEKPDVKERWRAAGAQLLHEKKIRLLCGEERTINKQDLQSSAGLFYPEKEFWQGCFNEALKQAKATNTSFSIQTPAINILVLPQQDRVYSSKSVKSALVIHAFSSPVIKSDVQVRFFDESESPVIKECLNSSKGFAYSMESFTWLISLVSSRGKLPEGMDSRLPLRLRHWPNFTRVENTPECFNIAAYWSKDFHSLETAINQLDVQARYIIAFLNGANALDLFEAEVIPAARAKRGRLFRFFFPGR
ncbi:MAG: hypothetical protein KDJ38_03065 [Gammaproteobacteria bacterium]|nr:hypothetical protein [Gammaproteobacteria bacterium]